jgi:cold shock CspA family protein
VAAPVGTAGPRLGRVASFDATRGLGTVTDDSGAVHPFHATAIADGSRRIDVGTRVSYSLAPGHGGRHEARTLVPCAGAADDAAVGPQDREVPASHHVPS